jgi:hypothetical protein
LGIGTKVTTFANQAAGTIQNVQNAVNPQNTGVVSPQYYAQQQAAQPPKPMSTAAKVGIGLGVVALVGTVVYLATTGKKKK